MLLLTRPLLIFKVRPFGIERNGNKWSASLALILVDLLQNDHFLFFLSVLDPSGEIFPSKVMVSITGGQERAETDARGRYGDQPVCPVSESANSKSERRALSRFAPRVIFPEREKDKIHKNGCTYVSTKAPLFPLPNIRTILLGARNTWNIRDLRRMWSKIFHVCFLK